MMFEKSTFYKLPKEEKETIKEEARRLILAGCPIAEISGRLGVHIQTVYNWKHKIDKEPATAISKSTHIVNKISSEIKSAEKQISKDLAEDETLLADVSDCVESAIKIVKSGMVFAHTAAKIATVFMSVLARKINDIKDNNDLILAVAMENESVLRIATSLMKSATQTKKDLLPTIDEEMAEKIYTKMMEQYEENPIVSINRAQNG